MKKQKTIYHLIVDKSGSMSDCIENTINGFNEQVNKIKHLAREFAEQEITIGLTLFNDTVEHQFLAKEPDEATLLTTKNYQPSGLTALLDSIGEVCEKCESSIQHQPLGIETTVIVVILTDGQENSSKGFTLSEIKRTIARLQATGKWTFSFIGADLNAIKVAERMNIKTHNSKTFSKERMNSEVWNELEDAMEDYMEKKRRGAMLDDFFTKTKKTGDKS